MPEGPIPLPCTGRAAPGAGSHHRQVPARPVPSSKLRCLPVAPVSPGTAASHVPAFSRRSGFAIPEADPGAREVFCGLETRQIRCLEAVGVLFFTPRTTALPESVSKPAATNSGPHKNRFLQRPPGATRALTQPLAPRPWRSTTPSGRPATAGSGGRRHTSWRTVRISTGFLTTPRTQRWLLRPLRPPGGTC